MHNKGVQIENTMYGKIAASLRTHPCFLYLEDQGGSSSQSGVKVAKMILQATQVLEQYDSQSVIGIYLPKCECQLTIRFMVGYLV